MESVQFMESVQCGDCALVFNVLTYIFYPVHYLIAHSLYARWVTSSVLLLCVVQRFGMDTAADTQLLRDEFHELEHQMAILQKELTEKQQELDDEKRNSEIVRHTSSLVLYPLVEFTCSVQCNSICYTVNWCSVPVTNDVVQFLSLFTRLDIFHTSCPRESATSHSKCGH